MRRIRLHAVLSSLSAILLAGMACAEPVVQQLTPLPTQRLSLEQVMAQTTAIEQTLQSLAEVPALPEFARTANGSARLAPLFSAQSGSWPFESFVHAGLFKVIAGYQSSHPRMVLIQGDMTLAQVFQQLNNPQVLRRHNDGYLLSYPLIISPGATLRVDNTELYLFAHSGAAIINQGRLHISQAKVESYSGSEHAQSRAYRPFIMAWAGSQTRIVDSQLTRLGYNAHLARGLSTARSRQQAASVPAARVLIRNSSISQLSSLYLQDAQARLENNHIQQMQLYGIEALDSHLQLQGNQIEHVRNHQGIRLSGSTEARLSGNQIKQTAKAAILLNQFSGRVFADNNLLEQSSNYALQIRQMASQATVALSHNQLRNVPLSLINAHSAGTLLLRDNQFEHSSNAIDLSGTGQTLILNNQFRLLGESALKSEGPSHILLGGNHFDGKVILQRLFQGDLLPIQSLIVANTITQPCYLQIGLSLPEAESQTAPCEPARVTVQP